MQLNVTRIHRSYFQFGTWYHSLLEYSWWKLMGLLAIIFIIINVFFGLLYLWDVKVGATFFLVLLFIFYVISHIYSGCEWHASTSKCRTSFLHMLLLFCSVSYYHRIWITLPVLILYPIRLSSCHSLLFLLLQVVLLLHLLVYLNFDCINMFTQ